MKILITGGGGFQGSHLAEFLVKEGHEVSVLNTHSEIAEENLRSVRGAISVTWGSVTDKEIVEKSVRGNDVVFHLAGRINVDESLLDPLAFFNANVLGTYNVLEAIKLNNNRLIFVSSCEVYGDGHDSNNTIGLTESSELLPNSPYAASKVASDRMSYAYFKSFNVDVTILRFFNVYGERQKSGSFGALIPIMVAKAIQGEDLTVFGDGSVERDYCHVSDIIAAYDIVLHNKDVKGKVINFASGYSTSVNDIVEYIAKKFNAKIVHKPARPGEVNRPHADISFAKSLGFSPKVYIWEGIDRYIDWYKKEEVRGK